MNAPGKSGKRLPPTGHRARRVILFLAASQLIACGACLAQATGETTLDTLRVLHEVRRVEIGLPREKLVEKYKNALRALRGSFQKAGTLSGITAVDEAVKSFEAGNFTVVESPDELKRVQEIYEREEKALEATEARELAVAATNYRQQLEDLKVTFTKAGRIDEAREIDDAINRLPPLETPPVKLASAMQKGGGFFGVQPDGNRVLFVVDHSLSLKSKQVEAIYKEVESGLAALKFDTQYQLILFAGCPLIAEPGWSHSGKGKQTVRDPDGKSYLFTARGSAANFRFEGSDEDLPAARWLNASSGNIRSSLEFLRKKRPYYGTDWELALRVGHRMTPPPDVILFISDGTGGNAPRPILELNERMGKPKIHTFAMQTSAGAKEFSTIATQTGGEFRVVLDDDEVVEGTTYLADPAKYKGRLTGK